MNYRNPLPPPTPEEIERKRASLAKLTEPDPVLAQRIRRITEMCKRDMPKPQGVRRDEVTA
jgi:hypothetical protein